MGAGERNRQGEGGGGKGTPIQVVLDQTKVDGWDVVGPHASRQGPAGLDRESLGKGQGRWCSSRKANPPLSLLSFFPTTFHPSPALGNIRGSLSRGRAETSDETRWEPPRPPLLGFGSCEPLPQVPGTHSSRPLHRGPTNLIFHVKQKFAIFVISREKWLRC